MPITISDQQIQSIALELEQNLDICDLEVSLDQIKVAVENWLLRTIYAIEQSPEHYMGGPMQYANSRVPEFKIKPLCVHFGWKHCDNAPQLGSVFCKDHQGEDS
jgi:hypothetical protein